MCEDNKMQEPEGNGELWSYLNVDNIFSSNYYGDFYQHDVKISHEQYVAESNDNNIEADEIFARSLLEEELSRLSMEESPELSWHNPSNSNYLGQVGGQYESDDEASHGERSFDGDNYYQNLDITDGSEFDGEVEKRLYEMIPVPHVPRINGDIPSLDEATSDHQRLLDRLQLYDLIEHKVQGDGNCQFRALSDQFYRTPEHHKFVRQQVVHQLKSHPGIYEGYVPMEYTDYLKRMAKSGEWGDHVTLQAAADSYGVKIVVVTSFKDTCYIEILPKDQQSKRVVYMSFWSEVHYNSIYPHGDMPPSDFKRKKKWWNF